MIAVTDHPAKMTPAILNRIGVMVQAENDRRPGPMRILDPFAGVGRVHELATTQGLHTVGVEIEPEWALCHERTICGNALKLPFPRASFAGTVTSICYGNRMADSHTATDPCKACAGRGWEAGEFERVDCRKCKGSGLTKRNTYTHRMRVALKDPGHRLHAESSAVMPFGRRYREFHTRAFSEMVRVTQPGGFAVVNISNHLETANGVTVEHRVSEWVMNAWLLMGCFLVEVVPVATPRNGEGANGGTRCEHEFVMRFRLPNTGHPTLF